ncbi:MAG: 16S rRNA (adenine(1518)-N(6)/adenine(1519)-N(6))-dimethyltransferase RsmA [Phycisphaerae bacterium]
MPAEHVQTKREIVELLSAAGVHPRKRLGQHFLIDGNLMRRLVACAELDPMDLVVEVGAGTGGLTDLIAGRVHKLLCIEMDRSLFAILEDRFREATGVTLIQGDILESKHRLNPEVARAIRSHDVVGSTFSRSASGGGSAGCVKLVANLPYQVVTPLVMNLLVDYPEVRRLCFTVQAEVGERITAGHGCKAYGPLSIVSQALCEIRTVARIPPEAFWPRPSVASVMIRMDVGVAPFADRDELRRFVTLVRGTFDHRRKTLRSALGYVIDEDQRNRVCQQFDPTRRPESFSVDEWVDLYKATRD